MAETDSTHEVAETTETRGPTKVETKSTKVVKETTSDEHRSGKEPPKQLQPDGR